MCVDRQRTSFDSLVLFSDISSFIKTVSKVWQTATCGLYYGSFPIRRARKNS